MAEQIIAVIEHAGVAPTPPDITRETLKPSLGSTQHDAPPPDKFTETLKPSPSPLVEDEREPLGLWIDNRFELKELVGKGSMCKVYKAFDHELKRIVAVKVLHDKFRSERETDIISRFRGEGELVASLSHPDIVQVYHTTQDPRLGIVMILELVEGPSLRDLLKEKTLTAKAAAEITVRIAHAIEYAHHGRLGPDGRPTPPVIHRDIKPANILVSGPESLLSKPSDFRLHVKITDFGLGKVIEPDSSHGDLTMHGMVIGTPSYMSPEQARGEHDLTIGVDVYGLGATLYEMLTGKPPFSGPTISVVLRQVQEDDPIPPTYLVPRIPPVLGAICLKCMEKSPANRYASAQELADDLERWLNHKATIARVPNWIQSFTKWTAKHPAKALMTSLLILLTIGITTLGFYSINQNTTRHYLQANQKILNDQRNQLKTLHNKSLSTLNGILDLLTDEGPMRNLAGLEPLHHKLNQFYQSLVLEESQDAVLDPRELGKAHLRLIRLISQKGNKSDAISVIQHGIDLYRKITQSTDSTPQDYFSLGQIHLLAAEVYQELGQYKEALAELSQGEEIFQNMLTQPKSNGLTTSVEREIGLAWHRRGMIQNLQPGKREQATTSYSTAIEKFKRLLEKNPDTTTRQELEKYLARSFSRRGNNYLDQGNFFKADEDYWVAHRYRIQAVRELTGINPEEIVEGHARWQLAHPTPENLEALFQLGRSYNDFGVLHFRLGTCSTAQDFWSKALKIQNRVVAISPNITEYKADLGKTLVHLSDATLMRIKQKGSQDESGDLQRCEKDLDRALGDFLEPLLRDDPASWSIRWATGKARYLRGEAALLKKEPKVAEKHLDRAWEIIARLVIQPNRRAMDHYLLAQIFGLKATLAEGDSSAFREMAALACQHLGTAIKMDYMEKTEREIRSELAFSALVNLPEFQAALMR